MRSAACLLAALLCACAPEKTWSSWASDPESTRYLPLHFARPLRARLEARTHLLVGTGHTLERQ